MPTVKINNKILTYNNIIYVDALNGDDINGDGSKDFPYASIQVAINNAASGNCIFIKKGIYKTLTRFDSYHLGVAIVDKDIDLIGEKKETIIEIDNSIIDTNNRIFGVVLAGAKVNIFNITFKLTKENTLNIWYYGVFQVPRYIISPSSLTVNNCAIVSTTQNSGAHLLGYFSVLEYAYFNNCLIDLSLNSDFEGYYYVEPIIPLVKNSLVKFEGNINWGTATNHSSPSYTTSILNNFTYDSDYIVTSEGWQNAGTGINPDGTQAHIGVYGGPYAWGKWINKILVYDGEIVKTYDPGTLSWSEVIEPLTTKTFLNSGVNSLTHTYNESISSSGTPLGNGTLFTHPINFKKYSSIQNLEVV